MAPSERVSPAFVELNEITSECADEGAKEECEGLMEGLAPAEPSLDSVKEVFGPLMERIKNPSDWTPSGDFAALGEKGCTFTKSFPVKSTCEFKYHFLVRTAGGIEEGCYKDLADPDTIVTLEGQA